LTFDLYSSAFIVFVSAFGTVSYSLWLLAGGGRPRLKVKNNQVSSSDYRLFSLSLCGEFFFIKRSFPDLFSFMGHAVPANVRAVYIARHFHGSWIRPRRCATAAADDGDFYTPSGAYAGSQQASDGRPAGPLRCPG